MGPADQVGEEGGAGSCGAEAADAGVAAGGGFPEEALEAAPGGEEGVEEAEVEAEVEAEFCRDSNSERRFSNLSIRSSRACSRRSPAGSGACVSAFNFGTGFAGLAADAEIAS